MRDGQERLVSCQEGFKNNISYTIDFIVIFQSFPISFETECITIFVRELDRIESNAYVGLEINLTEHRNTASLRDFAAPFIHCYIRMEMLCGLW